MRNRPRPQESLEEISPAARQFPREPTNTIDAGCTSGEHNPLAQIHASRTRTHHVLGVVRTAPVVVAAAVAFGILTRFAAVMMRNDGPRIVARAPPGPDRACDILDVLRRHAARARTEQRIEPPNGSDHVSPNSHVGA